LNPIRRLSEPLWDASGKKRYVEAQRSFAPFFPDQDRYYWKSLFFD
jgi:hypothetical protein